MGDFGPDEDGHIGTQPCALCDEQHNLALQVQEIKDTVVVEAIALCQQRGHTPDLPHEFVQAVLRFQRAQDAYAAAEAVAAQEAAAWKEATAR